VAASCGALFGIGFANGQALADDSDDSFGLVAHSADRGVVVRDESFGVEKIDLDAALPPQQR
jgi:hypothetical protein